jgi:calcium-dependent protein kinase
VRCGTPGYVAPEVINIKDMKTKYDPICDIFSLGLIFHILLLGVSAFPGRTYNEVLAQNRASNITFEAEEYKRLDPVALSLLTRMLKKSPH